ncbi:MAG: hypothetical protein AUJ20_02145 [Comamonadaceae bacterium CG1_02_60_18]|nr:MAG: hypothetical protein AUJ20_02145 [Comamonadaceae bacterium CG1_02_60_18]PIQ53997.1 MAG: hypothetical protein COW02_05710 [Comamonadaceae bacterium CG12_big_fil_rev_8_21_14_0_65_59_15]
MASSSIAQSPNWTQVTGPGTPGYGGLVRFSQGTPDGTAWMMTEGGGLHKSTDNGATWTASNNGLTHLRIKAGIINTARTPYSLDAATYGGGVFDSVDAGATWVAMNDGLGCTYVTALTGVGSRLLAGTDCQSASGVYFIEAGQGWTLATGLPGNVRVNSISRVIHTNFAVDFLLANTDQGIFKSTDSGSTWAALPASPSGPNGAVVYNVRALFYTPTGTSTNVTRLLATVEGAGIFVSEDGGNTWTASNTGLPANPVPMSGLRFDNNTSTLYLSLDGDGTYKSNDRGVSWTLAFAQNVLPSVRGVSPSSLVAGRLVADTLAGLRVSTDGGATWQGGGATGLPGGWTTNLKMDNATPTPNIYASAADGVYKFNGTQWAKMPPLPNMMYGQVKVRGSTVYATTSNKGVFKFNASTGVWNAINNGLPTNLVGRNPKYVGDGTNANNAYLGLQGDGIYYTSDAGANWSPRNTGLSGNALFINSIDAYGALIYISTDAGVFKSTNGGLNWALVFAPKNAANQTVPSGGVSADPLTHSTVYVGVFNTTELGASLPSNGVYKSTDAGATWTQLSGMAGKKVRDLRIEGADNTLVASVWEPSVDGGLFTSNDGGATWEPASNGLTTHLVNSVMATGTGAYAATRGAGLFKFDDTSSVYSEWKYFGAWLDSNGALSYGVDFGVNDANQTLSGTSLSGNGQSAVGALDTGANQWNAHLQFGATAPASNTVFTAVTTPKTGTPTTSNFSLRAAGYNTAVPTNIQPSGGANVTAAQPVFSWSAPVSGSGAYSYHVQVRTAGMSFTQVWSSPNVSGTSVTYNGPALVPGTSYQLDVQSQQHDSPTNTTYGAGASTTFCFQCSGGGGGGTTTGANYDQLFIGRNAGASPENFGLGVSYPRAANDGKASYAIACPGGKSASGTFGTAIVNGAGHEWYNVDLGFTQPATPFDCTSTVTYSDGTTNVATLTVDKFAAALDYPTAISLAANADVSSFTSVSFTNPLAGAANTRVQSNLWEVNGTGGYGQQLWYVGNTASPMTYTGPALTPNTHYQLAITTVEGTNVMHAAQYWIPFCYQCTGTGGGGTGSGTAVNAVSGWNLLGNSTTTAIDVASAYGDPAKVTTVWKWVPATSKWAFYAPSMTPANLATYAASKQYDVLTTIVGGEGFWVNAASTFTSTLPAGTAVSSGSFATTLGSGWSLISIGDNKTPRAFNNALSPTPPSAGIAAASILTTLWAWDSGKSSWYFYAPSLDNSNGLADYTFSKGYLDFGTTGTLAPGVGFWVNKP